MTYLDPSTQDAMRAAQNATEPLDRLAGIQNLISALENDAAALAAVRQALDAGQTWDEIAAAAGLSNAAAKWRWQGSDSEIAERHEAGRQRAKRPSSKPTDLPGMSVAEAAKHLEISVQGVYQRITRGQLKAETVSLDDGRRYKRVFPE